MPGPQPRACVSQIPAYVAGKPPEPRDGLTTYKLSSNENPYPPLPGVLEAAARAAEQMNRYPDMGSTALYAALSGRLGVPTDQLALATGSVGLIYQLVQAYCEPGDEVVYAWRSFEAYPIAVTAAGATSVQVPVLADGHHDLDAMAAAITDRTRIVHGLHAQQPDRPLGHPGRARRLPRPGARPRAGRRRRGVRRVRADGRRRRRPRDRAGATTTSSRPAPSPRPTAWPASASGTPSPRPRSPARCARSRSPSASRPSRRPPPSPRSRPRPQLLERVEALVAERDRVLAGLADAGVGVPEAQGNFVWFATGDRTGGVRRRGRRRSASSYARSPVTGARVSIGEPEANDRVIELAGTFEQSS